MDDKVYGLSTSDNFVNGIKFESPHVINLRLKNVSADIIESMMKRVGGPEKNKKIGEEGFGKHQAWLLKDSIFFKSDIFNEIDADLKKLNFKVKKHEGNNIGLLAKIEYNGTVNDEKELENFLRIF